MRAFLGNEFLPKFQPHPKDKRRGPRKSKIFGVIKPHFDPYGVSKVDQFVDHFSVEGVKTYKQKVYFHKIKIFGGNIFKCVIL